MASPLEGTKASKESCFAIETLTTARNTILKGSGDLLVSRAKIEKYRESDPGMAQDAYQELQKTHKRLLSALSNARLALLEAEENALADTAGKLHRGLSGFNLMSRAYKPVYEVLTNFAEKLPETADSVNAAVIGRLMNEVRMGYYPTDPDNISLMLRGIRFPEGVTTNLLDPCCGCGKALRQLAQGNNCYTYGVELDEHRAEEAQTRLHRVGMGSFFHSRISSEAFHLMFLNPPYLSVVTAGGSRARHEKRFLVESYPHLMMGGLLLYVIPFYRLTPDICKILTDNFTDLTVWRFTDSEFARFKQVAVMGVRKRRQENPEEALRLEALSYTPDKLPTLTEIPENRYTVPDTEKKVEIFKGERFNEKELERQLSHSDSLKRLINARSDLDRGNRHPLLPLSIGQIGLVGGSGLINGFIDCDTPHIIKGRIIKVRKEEREEKFSSRGIHTGAEVKEIISNKMVFNVLTPKGFKALT